MKRDNPAVMRVVEGTYFSSMRATVSHIGIECQ